LKLQVTRYMLCHIHMVSSPAWIFYSSPRHLDLAAALQALSEMTWTVSQHADEIHAGDRVYLWESGTTPGIVAVAEVIEATSAREEAAATRRFWRAPAEHAEVAPRVRLRIAQVLPAKLARAAIVRDPRLADLALVKTPRGASVALTDDQQQALDELMVPPPFAEPAELCASFARALRRAGLSFGEDHDWLVRCFLSSVLAKPFVILTGLSGSGKTQLGLKLGQWLGDGRYRIVAVRPDWTAPDALLGYEDVMLPVEGDRRAWHVPDTLELILRAARDPAHPYLLLLDEMNLAHVERYFADVLSGLESREPVIPNLARDATGYWRVPPGEPSRIALPRNLIVIGTVNVDESTHAFSPKVLDRANLVEFRVPSDALPLDPALLARPVRCAPASAREVASVLRICLDDAWPTGAPSSIATVAGYVRNVHGGLLAHGREFGHRTYYEGLRLAALLDASGIGDANAALDVVLLQKVLPRFHGAGRDAEPALRSLGAYAFEKHAMIGAAVDFDVLAVPAGKPALLPRSFAKVVRLMRGLHASRGAGFLG
jgi:5-methylcytosine-specific restriction enzyme B